MNKTVYGDWSVQPELITDKLGSGKLKTASAIWKEMTTKHEGDVLYHKFWNFWARAGVSADTNYASFFRDYESTNADADKLLQDVGFPWAKAETEEEVWKRIGLVWNWCKSKVTEDSAAYGTITSVPGTWPSILDFGKYYALHGGLAWAACFSKAHLFTTLLGRMVYPRFRFAIAESHHTEGGAPSTASHVFVAVYVADHWFYLDPTAVSSTSFPVYINRASIGVSSFATVDYDHPYKVIPVPLSELDHVPYLGA